MSSEVQKTILLVEDEALIAMGEALTLEQYGYRAITVSSGEEAVKIVETDPDIDLILMDIDLGSGIDGTEAAEIILKGKDIPVVFLSSHTETEIVKKTEKITSYGYVVKNTSETVLDASIKMAYKLFEAKTQKLEKEKALLDSEALLNTIQQLTKVGGWEFDIEKITMSWTDELYRIHDFQPEEFVSADDAIERSVKCYYPDDRSVVMAAFKKCVANGEPYDLEFPFVSSKGTRKWIRTITRPVMDGDRIAKVVGNFMDITERKMAEESMLKRNNEYRTLFDSVSDAIILHDMEARIIDVNAETCRRYGYTKDQLLKMKIYQIDSKDEAKHIPDRIKALKENGRVSFETVHISSNGNQINTDVNSQLVHLQEKPLILSFCRDFTEDKQAEESLRLSENIVNNLQVGLHIYKLEDIDDDRTLRMISANQAAADFTGITIDDIIGKTLDESFPELRVKGIPQIYADVVRTGKPTVLEDIFYSDDRVIEGAYSVKAFPLPDNHVGVSLENIIERKKAEETLKRALHEKETLLMEIHHRVKNNLQLIIDMLRLQQQHTSETDGRSFDDIINRVRVFGDIHRRLYQQEDISRINFVQHLEKNLRDLIIANNVDKKNIELELNIANPVFTLDEAITCGLLMNELISNSLKHAFTDQGTISITIIHDPEGELEKIAYSDNGIGIVPLVEGFGTKIINALAKQLNMSVDISAKEGIRFDFIRKGFDLNIGNPEGKILYVEDEILIAMEKIDYLKNNGYSVHENVIISGEKAVKYVKESSSKPSLIIMDIRLYGKMNGIEAAEKIRRENPFIPIIFTSGYEDNNTLSKVSAIPNTALLNKTSTPEEMKKAIDSFQK